MCSRIRVMSSSQPTVPWYSWGTRRSSQVYVSKLLVLIRTNTAPIPYKPLHTTMSMQFALAVGQGVLFTIVITIRTVNMTSYITLS